MLTLAWVSWWLYRYVVGLEDYYRQRWRLPPYHSGYLWMRADADINNERYINECIAIQQVATSLILCPVMLWSGWHEVIRVYFQWSNHPASFLIAIGLLIAPLIPLAIVDYWVIAWKAHQVTVKLKG